MRDRALPAGQLAIVPGATHCMAHERRQLLEQIIGEFLADPTPQRIMRIRR